MDIEKFLNDFNKNLPSEPDNPDLVSVYEEAMLSAGFDFSDAETFIEEYILPEMKMLRAEFLKNDQEALTIYRNAGLTEMPVEICGMMVSPGDIIHMDENGAVKFPREYLDEVLERAKRMHKLEEKRQALLAKAKSGQEIMQILSGMYD